MKPVASHSPMSDFLWTVLGAILVIFLGLIDYLTGYELAFSIFYLVPIFLVGWYANGRLGLLIAGASAVAWFIADFTSGNPHSSLMIFFWNTIIRLGFFIIFTALLAAFKSTYLSSREMARNDFVTGAMSNRFFYEQAQVQINRSQRSGQPFSLAYIDLDNFKKINDTLGHSIGDRVLQAVAGCVLPQVRGTDIFARLGGDEFALLLPEAGEVAARAAINRLLESTQREMSKNNWPVTFSIGVVTFLQPPESVDEMVGQADMAMYAIKSNSKSGVNYQLYAPAVDSTQAG